MDDINKKDVENQSSNEEKADYFESQIQLVIFQVNNVEYAINIRNIISIIRYSEFSPLPNAPRFVKGVINLRGKVVPIVDLRERFISQNIENTKKTRIMIATMKEKEIGLVADAVSDIIGLSEKQIEPPLPVISGLKMEYIEGIAKINNKLIIIINIEQILTSDESSIIKESVHE